MYHADDFFCGSDCITTTNRDSKVKPGPMTYRLSMTLIVLSAVLGLRAQQTVLRVLDQTTAEPCMYANVVLTGLEGRHITAGATDTNGKIAFDLDRTARVTVPSAFMASLPTLRVSGTCFAKTIILYDFIQLKKY